MKTDLHLFEIPEEVLLKEIFFRTNVKTTQNLFLVNTKTRYLMTKDRIAYEQNLSIEEKIAKFKICYDKFNQRLMDAIPAIQYGRDLKQHLASLKVESPTDKEFKRFLTTEMTTAIANEEIEKIMLLFRVLPSSIAGNQFRNAFIKFLEAKNFKAMQLFIYQKETRDLLKHFVHAIAPEVYPSNENKDLINSFEFIKNNAIVESDVDALFNLALCTYLAIPVNFEDYHQSFSKDLLSLAIEKRDLFKIKTLICLGLSLTLPYTRPTSLNTGWLNYFSGSTTCMQMLQGTLPEFFKKAAVWQSYMNIKFSSDKIFSLNTIYYLFSAQKNILCKEFANFISNPSNISALKKIDGEKKAVSEDINKLRGMQEAFLTAFLSMNIALGKTDFKEFNDVTDALVELLEMRASYTYPAELLKLSSKIDVPKNDNAAP